MTGFSADWLALREPADVASRSSVVLDATAEHFRYEPEGTFHICDLGSGTGASIFAFSKLFARPQFWTLVDHDADNLEQARSRVSNSDNIQNVTIATELHDLAVDPAPWSSDTSLVTATALFDLVSAAWLSSFADRLAAGSLPLLATLTYDGRHVLEPTLPLDDEMMSAFNTHQRSDKGFGPAVGPEAVGFLSESLVQHNYAITVAESSWHLSGERDKQLIDALLDGWAAAVLERDLLPENAVHDWHRSRRGNTVKLQVGHLDLFAAPPR